MPIRTQFDTSSYLQGRGRQTSLGEVMGAIQSVQGMVGRSRAIKQQEQSLDDDKYLNDLYAKTFADWDGKNVDDFQQRNTKIMQEVAKSRGYLYNKAMGMSNQLQGALQQSAIYQQDMASKKRIQDREVEADLALERMQGMMFAKDEGPTLDIDESIMRSGILKYADIPEVKGALEAISKIQKKEQQSNLSVWEKKLIEAQRIDALPEGPEKEAAKQAYLNAGATGTAYTLSDEGIDRAGKRASTVEFAKIPGKIAGQEAETKVVDQFEDATTLRKEFDALSKDYKKVRDSYNRVVASGQEPSAAGDLALIFNYMKILDPGSVVRESEFATAAASGSFGERLQAAAQKILRGERLSDEMRKDFINRGKVLYERQAETQQLNVDKYTKLAQKRGLDPKDVVSDVQTTEKKRKVWNPTTNSFELR